MNLVNGVEIECYDEGLDNTKNPAKVIIRKNGKTVATVFARVGQIKGADGGMYPAVEFSMRGKDPVSESANPIEERKIE